MMSVVAILRHSLCHWVSVWKRHQHEGLLLFFFFFLKFSPVKPRVFVSCSISDYRSSCIEHWEHEAFIYASFYLMGSTGANLSIPNPSLSWKKPFSPFEMLLEFGFSAVVFNLKGWKCRWSPPSLCHKDDHKLVGITGVQLQEALAQCNALCSPMSTKPVKSCSWLRVDFCWGSISEGCLHWSKLRDSGELGRSVL